MKPVATLDFYLISRLIYLEVCYETLISASTPVGIPCSLNHTLNIKNNYYLTSLFLAKISFLEIIKDFLGFYSIKKNLDLSKILSCHYWYDSLKL